MSNNKDSIVKSTKEGALYIVASQLFAKESVKEILTKLETSSIKRKIDALKERKEPVAH
ncbi:MAG: hypothetical protein MUF68_02910 [Cyclobacteriaceae bacterium]|jgi:hypothetical protein|nr:hypothetical protein [Cyclobacteriaceae bacterium]